MTAIRRLLTLGAALVFCLAQTPPSPTDPGQEGRSSALCVEHLQISFAQGLDMSRMRRTAATTRGETGRIVCIGSLNGKIVTGPGTLGLEGIVHGTCINGELTGTLTMTVPTSTGQEHLESPITMGWQAGVGLSSSPPGRNGLVQFIPSGGDCLNSPATTATILDEDVFSS